MKTMGKKCLGMLLSILLIAGCCLTVGLDNNTVQAAASGAFRYSVGVDDAGVQSAVITDYLGIGTEVVVPAELDGYPVSHIGWQAFAETDTLTRVVIEEGVECIDWQAFLNCPNLTSVSIPTSLTSIDIEAFDGCGRLTAISVAPGNPAYVSQNGVLFNGDQTQLVEYPEGKTGFYSVPEGTQRILSWAFSGCSGLTGILIPDSVTDIDPEAFLGCRDFVIYGSIGSAAEQFARQQGIPFFAMDNPVYDLDQDGRLTVADTMILAQQLVDGAASQEFDFNQDETVDVLDIMNLVQLLADQ